MTAPIFIELEEDLNAGEGLIIKIDPDAENVAEMITTDCGLHILIVRPEDEEEEPERISNTTVATSRIRQRPGFGFGKPEA